MRALPRVFISECADQTNDDQDSGCNAGSVTDFWTAIRSVTDLADIRSTFLHVLVCSSVDHDNSILTAGQVTL